MSWQCARLRICVEFESQWKVQEGVSGRKFAAKSPGKSMGECLTYVDHRKFWREGVGIFEMSSWGSCQPDVFGQGIGVMFSASPKMDEKRPPLALTQHHDGWKYASWDGLEALHRPGS